MSKLIKPGDVKAFQSAREFQKEHFRLDRRPSTKDAASAGCNPPNPGENPLPEAAVDESSPELLREGARRLVEDAESRAEQIISEAESRAQQLVREAQVRADDIFRQARERGRADGIEEVREKVEKQRQESSQMLSSFVEKMKEREADLVRSLTPRLAELAVELAGKIIHREVAKDSSLVTKQAEQAIAKILQREKLVIRVNRDDEASMREHKPVLLGMFDGIDRIKIITDPEVERGGCIVETDLIKVDAQPQSQLRAACRTILGEEDK